MASLDQRSIKIRQNIFEILRISQRGHIGSALSLVEIIRVLYDKVLNIRPHQPDWEDRDRFILSKGHGCLALYAMLAEKEFFPSRELQLFCKAEGILGGHPEYCKIPGVEASTGALGHGLSIGIGQAINSRYEKRNYRTFILLGDGECNEGSIWEGAMCASKHGLDNLTVLIDYNKQQSYDLVNKVQPLEPFADKWRSFNFAVKEVDGHDVSALEKTFKQLPIHSGKPNAIICHTIKGRGVSFVEGDLSWHHKSRISHKEIDNLIQSLDSLSL